jgi:hypothetical protein
MIRLYPGYVGLHTREQAPGAMPNGTRVVKVMFEKGDTHPIGSIGTVLGSLTADPNPVVPGVEHFYFIEWDDQPRLAVGVVNLKIAGVT